MLSVDGHRPMSDRISFCPDLNLFASVCLAMYRASPYYPECTQGDSIGMQMILGSENSRDLNSWDGKGIDYHFWGKLEIDVLEGEVGETSDVGSCKEYVVQLGSEIR